MRNFGKLVGACVLALAAATSVAIAHQNSSANINNTSAAPPQCSGPTLLNTAVGTVPALPATSPLLIGGN